jgi:pimeloyl-ACP methyl ester carboxylesterase
MEIAFDRGGSGPPLVLLHPLGADRHVWDPVRARLQRERTVIALDLPGFGDSPPLTAGSPTPRALAEAVAVQIARLGLGRPHVAGNSLGGWVALELGLRDAASSVTAIAPAGLWAWPLRPKASWGHRLGRRLEPLPSLIVSRPAGRRLLLAGSMAHPRRVPAADATHLVQAYARAPAFVATNDAMRAAAFTGLERIRCPVTLVWPEHDRLIARPRWLPDNVRNVELPGTGHMPMWDAPDEVAAALLRASVDAVALRGGGARAPRTCRLPTSRRRLRRRRDPGARRAAGAGTARSAARGGGTRRRR